MNCIEVQDLPENVNLVSFQDTARFLNLFYREVVEELLECFTDFTDFDIIAELTDILDLNITAVIEPVNKNTMLVHGYIHDGGVLA